MNCIREAEQHGLLSEFGLGQKDGLSGEKTAGTLQRFVSLYANEPEACYLEIGVYQGLTLVAAGLSADAMPCYGIDNFRILDPEGKNLDIVEQRLEKFNVANAHLINEDFEVALHNLESHIGNRKICVYFVDGPHDYRSQLICLLLIKPYLHDNAVIVIDDANYPDVRQATADFLLSHPEFKLAFDAYTPDHPANLDSETLIEAEQNWLNGINIIVRDPDGLLPDMAPPTISDKSLYFHEWLTHRHQIAELAPESLDLVQAMLLDRTEDKTEIEKTLRSKFAESREIYQDRKLTRNTYSKNIAGSRFNNFK